MTPWHKLVCVIDAVIDDNGIQTYGQIDIDVVYHRVVISLYGNKMILYDVMSHVMCVTQLDTGKQIAKLQLK